MVQAGLGTNDLVALTGDRLDHRLHGLHAGSGDEEVLRIERLAVKPGMIVRERLAQSRQAALIGVEGLAVLERLTAAS